MRIDAARRVRHFCQQMKTATVREAQHHFSKLLEDVAAGEEITITRRGVEVAKLVPSMASGHPMEKAIDWAAWAKEQRKFLDSMPKIEGSALDADREGYRW